MRAAGPQDRAALTLLLARTWRRHGSSALEDQAELLHGGLSTISMTRNDAHGFLGLHLARPRALRPKRGPISTSPQWNRAAGSMGRWQRYAGRGPGLQRAGGTGIVCLAPPGWLEEGLVRAGFAEEDKVITYAHSNAHSRLPADAPAVLRPARAGDADEILRVNALAFGPFWQYDDAVVLGWVLASDRAVVAEVEGRTVGFAVTTLGLKGNYAHLIRVATHPDYRGRGIGRQLVVDAIRFSREAEAPGLALNTQASNRISRSLYESLGFRQTGHVLAAMVYRL